MSKPAGTSYEFGPFRLEPQERLLVCGGKPVALPPKAFHTLVVLVENRGRLVAKDALMQAIWPDTFVEEVNLSQNVSLLRKVLGDTPQEQRYIQTVAGRGYRFCGEVRVLEEDAFARGQDTAVIVSHSRSQIVVEQHSDWTQPVLVALLCLLAVAAGVGAFERWSHHSRRITSTVAQGRIMLAVLPFDNSGGASQQEYLSDGLTQELITELGRLDPRKLGVIAPSSILRYKGSRVPIKQIVAELGVQYVLRGGVKQDSGRLRLWVQLISAATGVPVWTHSYEEPRTKIRQLERRLGREVAGEVRLQLTPEDQQILSSSPTVNPASYDAYLHGRYFWEKRNQESYRQALEWFRTAVAEDPDNATAYAGLAGTYLLLGGYGLMPQQESVPRAETAARQALRLDPSLAEAHTALGKIAENYSWDWAAADTEYRQAIRLDPNYALGHHWYAEYLASMGRLPQAIVEIRRAEELDPMSPSVYSDAGKIYWFARQNGQALEQDRKALELDPRFSLAHVNVALALLAEGSGPQAITELRAARKWDDTRLTLSILGYCYAATGQRGQAEEVLGQLNRLAEHDALDPSFFGRIYIALGDKDRAFTWLQAEYTVHSAALNRIKVSPIYDPLRSDPRFSELLRRLRLNGKEQREVSSLSQRF